MYHSVNIHRTCTAYMYHSVNTLLLAVFVYCGVAVLVIVNGQSTTDDDIDKDEINRLIDIVAELRTLRTEQAELRAELAKSNDRIAELEGQLLTTSATKPDASKLSTLTLIVLLL